MSIGFWQIAIVVILVVLLFGRGKISSLMGDVAKGIKSFKKGMAIPFLKLFIPLATSPIKLEIFPLPKRRTTKITTIAICQKPILMMCLYYFSKKFERKFYSSSSFFKVLLSISSIFE